MVSAICLPLHVAALRERLTTLPFNCQLQGHAPHCVIVVGGRP
jgi:hypothetical protein